MEFGSAWSFAPNNHSNRAMLRAGDSGGRVLGTDNQSKSGDDTCKQQALAAGVVLNSTTTTMVVDQDFKLSELDLDLDKIIQGCECWSPDEFLGCEEQAVDMPNLVDDESGYLKCKDITAVFERLEYQETTVVVKQRKISVCDKAAAKGEKVPEIMTLATVVDKDKMTKEERQALRKENNKKSASNSRKRKKEELMKLQEDKAKLRAEVETLEKRVAELEQQNNEYRKKMPR